MILDNFLEKYAIGERNFSQMALREIDLIDINLMGVNLEG